MCGISGFISNRRITAEQLTVMNDTMYHRGPDDSGVNIYNGTGAYSVGMAQRRLSILDLSELGHQPMSSDDGRITIVYNGEIYNFLDIKARLSKDFEFKSNCDTEVILKAYLKWGIGCIESFNGMFAIALFDRQEECVYFVRDRIGKKPLYYELEDTDEGTNIYFGSELKPLMARPGFEKKINKKVVGRYLYQQYINAPDTIFENVHKLEPGMIMKFDMRNPHNPVSFNKYWDVANVYHTMQSEPVKEYAEAKTILKELLKQAVSLRMISDVPLGTFLSGGYDSSLVTAMACEASVDKVKTFSIGFEDPKYNEAVYARKVAEYLGTDHTETIISEKEMYDLVGSIPKYYDEPFADSSQISTMLVSALAKEKVTVALSGDGGDEFFCGYNIYERVEKLKALDKLGALTYGVCNLPGLKKAGLLDKMPLKIRVVANNRNRETKTQVGSLNYLETVNKMMGERVDCFYPIESRYGVDNWQVLRMLVDMDTYLPGDILCKVDRASMKYSLETRCPILDKDVMEYSFRLNHSFKYQNGNKKRILKDIAYDYIPKELLERPKVGFAVPIDKWLRGPLRESLISFCDKDFLNRQGIFDGGYISDAVTKYLSTGDMGPSSGANYSKIFWSLYVFQQWYNEYMV